MILPQPPEQLELQAYTNNVSYMAAQNAGVSLPLMCSENRGIMILKWLFIVGKLLY